MITLWTDAPKRDTTLENRLGQAMQGHVFTLLRVFLKIFFLLLQETRLLGTETSDRSRKSLLVRVGPVILKSYQAFFYLP